MTKEELRVLIPNTVLEELSGLYYDTFVSGFYYNDDRVTLEEAVEIYKKDSYAIKFSKKFIGELDD